MNTQSRIGKWSVIIGIVIVLNLFFNYALSLVYKQPLYGDYCPMIQVVNMPQTEGECVYEGGQWTNDPSYANMYAPNPVPAGISKTGYCNLDYTCSDNFNKTTETYNRNVFIILVVLGAISVALGNFFAGNAVISSGLSMAGVLSFIIASTRYWSSANDAIRVVILAIALGLLFWIAYKKFKNNG